jgi:2-oxo-3-hexenedioate decarboxylase/2-keto-4-pentenoate hydratase
MIVGMEQQKISEAVEIYRAVRLERRKLAHLPQSCTPRDSAEAYQVQDALNERLADLGLGAVSGHKIGCTSKIMQDYLKIDQPCSGGIYAETVFHELGERAHALYCGPGVECEIAVGLGADLGPQGAPYTKDSVADAVENCMAAIEIVDDRFVDYRELDLPTLLADDFFNAGCVLGAPVGDWRRLDIGALRGEMTVNGGVLGSGFGRDVMGHPFHVLAWLANSFVARGRFLKAGEFILTGSLVETHWCAAGDEVRVEIDGLGVAAMKFPAA